MEQNRKEQQHDQHLQAKKKNYKRFLIPGGLLVLILIVSSVHAIFQNRQPGINTKGESLQIHAKPTRAERRSPTKVPPQPTKVPPSRPPTTGIYYGVYATSWLQDLSAVTAFEQDAQKPVSIVMWYQGWGSNDSSQNFQPTWMENVREHGSIPMVSWEPWDYRQGTVNQPAYSLQNIINGSLDAYITSWARASKAWGHPYFLRFAAEMNGNWFSWSEGVNGNTQGQYVKAWQHVHNLFTAQGATNVTWVWAPNMEYHGSLPLKGLYPGSAYVDWVGIDGYNWDTVHNHHWQTFAQVFQQTYTDILSMSLHKPLIIAETASANRGNDKAGWITDAFGTQLLTAFPEIKGFVWFNVNKETDWRIEASPSAQAAFARVIASPRYVSNQYAGLNTSPIPVPTIVSSQH